MNATANKPARRAAADKPVNLERLTDAQVLKLTPDQLVASTKDPRTRRVLKSVFALHGAFKA